MDKNLSNFGFCSLRDTLETHIREISIFGLQQLSRSYLVNLCSQLSTSFCPFRPPFDQCTDPQWRLIVNTNIARLLAIQCPSSPSTVATASENERQVATKGAIIGQHCKKLPHCAWIAQISSLCLECTD